MAARPDRVSRAVALIAPPTEHRAECEASVRAAFWMVEKNPFAQPFHENSKRAKLQAGGLGKDIRRLLARLKHADLPEHLRNFFPDADLHGIFAKDFASTLRLPPPHSRLHLKASETERWLKELLKRAEAARTKKGKTIRRDATKKKRAVMNAHHLLRGSKKKEISAAKGSKLCQLAALLYGKPNANLQKQCAEFLRTGFEEDDDDDDRPKRGSK